MYHQTFFVHIKILGLTNCCSEQLNIEGMYIVLLLYNARHRYLPKNVSKKQEYFINGIYFGKLNIP